MATDALEAAMNTFRRILSDILFGIGVLWQIFLLFAVFINEVITRQDVQYGLLCSLLTVAVLYISLKIRPARPISKKATEDAKSSDVA
jgi:uncharacterized YccA/Bax inhibitor family protein